MTCRIEETAHQMDTDSVIPTKHCGIMSLRGAPASTRQSIIFRRPRLLRSIPSLVLTLQRGMVFENAGLWLSLSKAMISFFAALSAAAGLLLAPHSSLITLLTVTAGVFLISCGACTLNQWQEKDTDALMARTAKRPLPAGQIKSGYALISAFAAICLGEIILSSTGFAPPILGIVALLWYNGFYTHWKRASAFAAIPGALVGAIPPAIGWTAGGGNIFDLQLAALSFFFYMWQVPHFLVHFLSFGGQYEEAGLPSLTKIFTKAQLDRLTFQWLMATAVSLQLIIMFGLMNSPFSRVALLATSLWLAIIGMEFLPARKPRYVIAFKRINWFILAVISFVFLDKLLRLF